MNLFERRQDYLTEDASYREALSPTADKYRGRGRLEGAATIELDRIEIDPQHREHFDQESLQRLADSLKEKQISPIQVRFDPSRGKYVVIAGERRYRAAKLADLKTIDCIVADYDLSPADVLRLQIIENCLREDLRPIEQAKSFQTLIHSQNWNAAELSRHIHISEATISRSLKLLALPEDVQQQIDVGKITPTEALRQYADRQSLAPKRKCRRITREEKIQTTLGKVSVKGRRLLTDDVLIAVLTEALEFVRHRRGSEQQQRDAA